MGVGNSKKKQQKETERKTQETSPSWLHEDTYQPVWVLKTGLSHVASVNRQNQTTLERETVFDRGPVHITDEGESCENIYEDIDEQRSSLCIGKVSDEECRCPDSRRYRPELPLPMPFCCRLVGLIYEKIGLQTSQSPPPLPKRKFVPTHEKKNIFLQDLNTSNQPPPLPKRNYDIAQEENYNCQEYFTSSTQVEDTSYTERSFSSVSASMQLTASIQEDEYETYNFNEYEDESTLKNYGYTHEEINKTTSNVLDALRQNAGVDSSEACGYIWEESETQYTTADYIINNQRTLESEFAESFEETYIQINRESREEVYVLEGVAIQWLDEQENGTVSDDCDGSDKQYFTKENKRHTLQNKREYSEKCDVFKSKSDELYEGHDKKDNQNPGNNHLCNVSVTCKSEFKSGCVEKDNVSVISEEKPLDDQNIHHFEAAVILHRTRLIEKISVHQILPYLYTILDQSEIDRIRADSQHDNKMAAGHLLDLIRSSNELGKWQMLVEALENTGHKAAAELMRQHPIESDERELKLLHVLAPSLIDLITPKEILPTLQEHEIITEIDAEEITATEKYYGSVRAAEQLLRSIPMKHPFWFCQLLTALLDHSELRKLLEIAVDDKQSDSSKGAEYSKPNRDEQNNLDHIYTNKRVKISSDSFEDQHYGYVGDKTRPVSSDNREVSKTKFITENEQFDHSKNCDDSTEYGHFEMEMLEKEVAQLKETCELMDRKNSLLRKKRKLTVELNRKKKEEAALKAAMENDSPYGEDGCTLDDTETLNTSATRAYGKMTLDFRDNTTTAGLLSQMSSHQEGDGIGTQTFCNFPRGQLCIPNSAMMDLTTRPAYFGQMRLFEARLSRRDSAFYSKNTYYLSGQD